MHVANALLGPLGLRESPARQALAIVLNLSIAIGLYWAIDRRVLARRREWFTTRHGRLATASCFGLTATGLLFGMVLLH